MNSKPKLLDHNPLTIWMTGLSGAGKSTLAHTLEKDLLLKGRACFILDGDVVRLGLCRGLSYTLEDRAENVRRVAEVAKLMNDAGLIVIVALISPFISDREMARNIIGQNRFLEVYLSTSIETCEQRDVKGLYKRARSGEIPNFTGIDSPYEPPRNPHASIDTSEISLDVAIAQLTAMIDGRLTSDFS